MLLNMTSPLDSMLCFGLYSASHATTQAYREVLKPLGLTYPQFLVLVVLLGDDGQRIADLGERMQLDSGTLSPLVKRLEGRGLVRRERDRTDERAVRVFLTDAGAAMRDDLAEATSCIAAGFGVALDEAQQTMTTLRRLTRGMQELTAARR